MGALLERARSETGLKDFGDNWFVKPLTRLVDDVNREAGLLSPESSAGARIQSALSDRLKLVQYFKDNPAAKDEKIELACAIIGLPRTGSTMMHRLLASSPKLTALWWGRLHFLFLPGERVSDPAPRQDAAKAMVDWLLTEWPDFESIDPMDAMAINEEVVLLDRTFLSTTYDSMMPIHQYGFWQAEQIMIRRSGILWLHAGDPAPGAMRGEARRPGFSKTPHLCPRRTGWAFERLAGCQTGHDASQRNGRAAELLQYVCFVVGQFVDDISEGSARSALEPEISRRLERLEAIPRGFPRPDH
ncbi:MAG: sulfotransferase [Sphingomonadales bacterium]|nr:sulfotransferase [Sphingomonadales bacterium]